MPSHLNSLDKKLEEGLNIIPFPVVVIDSNGMFAYVNHLFKNIFGIKASKFADLFQSGFHMDYYLNVRYLKDEQVILKATNGFLTARLNIAPLVGNENLRMCFVQEIPSMTGSSSFLQFTRDNVGLVAYSLEKIGPKPFYIDSFLYHFISNLEVTLIKMGLYLMTAIGQGQDHASGLFGPLPVPGHDEHLAIVYSFNTSDATADDPRVKDQRLVMLVLVFPVFIEEMINDRVRLRAIFRGELGNIKCYQDLTYTFLAELKNKILLEDISEDKLTRTLQRKLSALYHMSQELLKSPKSSFKIIMNYVEAVLDFKYSGIAKLDRDKNKLVVVAATGYDRDLSDFVIDLESTKSVVAKCAREKIILNIPDVKKCDFYLEMDPVIKSELAVPVIMNERLLGVINAESENISAFSESDVQLMENLAGRVALVFRQRLLEEKLKAVRALIYELLDVQRSLEKVFQTICEFADRVLDFKIFSILLINEKKNELVIVAHRGYPADFEMDNLRIPLQSKISVNAKAARTGNTVNIGNVKAIDFFLETDPAIRSELAVPVKDSAGKVLGVVNAEALQINAFNKEDEEFMEIIAGHVSVILKIFYLQRQDKSLARYKTYKKKGLKSSANDRS